MSCVWLKLLRGIFSGREVKALPALTLLPEASRKEERRRYLAY